MVLQFVSQALRGAEELKHRILRSTDLLNDNDALIARLQLQKIYQQVLVLDLEYAINKKIEQDLWNLGFKNYIDALQKLVKDRKNPKRNEYQGLLNICLESASGFYLILLEEICVTFNVSLPFPSYRKYTYLQSNSRKSHIDTLIKQPQKSSCYYICQHCLVHLGDIARYKFRCKQAEIFYRNAIILSPSSGQPYNQLALLETSRGDKLATVFYYVRSIAVRNPFPAATSNLALTLNKANVNGDWNTESKTVLSSNEFITLFLKVHALLHLTTDILPCATYVRLLSTSLTAHVATESFTSVNLVQMMVINMFAYYNVNNEGGNAVDDNQLTADEKFTKALLVELIAGSLNAFLLPIYTYKQEDSLLQYFALPAIKITLDWLRIHSYVLDEPGFVNRLQIWPAFCKLINELEPLLKSYTPEKLKNVTLPEEQDLQGFIPLQNAIPEFRYFDNEVDLDNLSKLRAHRIQSFATWLANESRFSLIKMCKSESGNTKFEATISGVQSSNELIIQQLEELLQNDCSIKEDTQNSNGDEIEKSAACDLDTAAVINLASNVASSAKNFNKKNKKAGILKTQSFLDKKKEDAANENKKNPRKNIALQTILKRNQEQEHKQVTFKTPSPSLSTCSDTQDSISPSMNHSQLWPSNLSSNNSQTSLQPATHSMFISSFSGAFPDPFRTLPPTRDLNAARNTTTPSQPNLNFNKNSPFYTPTINPSDQLNFSPVTAPTFQKPFIGIPNDMGLDIYGSNGATNDNRNQNVIDVNLMAASMNDRHVQRNQFHNQTNLNFLPPWKQDSNPWWVDDKQQKMINSGPASNTNMIDDQSNSFFHYRNPIMSQVSQPSNPPSFNPTNQMQFQPQQIPAHLRPISQPPQQHPQSSHLRTQNSSANLLNLSTGLWPTTFKSTPQPQNNINYSSNVIKPIFDPLPSYNQNTLSNTEDKNTYGQHSQLPNNTYSLFNPMWSARTDDQLNQSNNTNPLAVLTQQSIWSEGISPLQRLLEQQKQIREGSAYHNTQQPPNE
ncbi:nonsense-mediated mRNA decay factor SMG7-like [Planococcus citri]|uniref:nonsense-mediated mRNA decay factor SMG7-like n=1 Tax=Planococcus citri TaxID=170843 RepID=UPI0031F8B1CB